MERGTFPRILDAFDEFVMTVLNTDGDGRAAPVNAAIQLRLIGEGALPRYAVIDPESESVLRSWAFESNFASEPGTFAAYLNEALEVYHRNHQGN